MFLSSVMLKSYTSSCYYVSYYCIPLISNPRAYSVISSNDGVLFKQGVYLSTGRLTDHLMEYKKKYLV